MKNVINLSVELSRSDWLQQHCSLIIAHLPYSPKNKLRRKENIGKSLLDVAKLTFASFILGGMLRGELPQFILILTGIVVSAVCFILGILWTSKKPEKKGKE